MINTKHTNYILVLVLALSAICVYLPSISAPFIFDDHHMIVNNFFIKNPHFLGMFFKGYVTSYPIPKGMCRPLLMLTFAFNYANGGLNPVGYHIINIIFHFLNAVLLFTLLKSLTKICPPQGWTKVPQGLLFLITLLFTVHPINTEAVTYISSRSDLMVTFFILSGFILYLKEKYTFSVSCYALALLTKETALVYPILISGYFLLYTPRRIKEILKDKRLITFIILIVIITLSYLFYKNAYFGGISTGKLRPLSFNIILQSWVTFFYIRLFLWPNNLNFFHVNPDINSVFQVQSLFFIGILTLIVLVFILRKKHYLLSLGIFFYLVGLLPKFYAALKVPVSEHHFYLPGVGIYIVLTAILIRPYLKNRRYFLYPAVGVILVLIILTVERNYQLNNPLKVWTIGVKKEPKHIGNWINLGVTYKLQGNLEKAKEIFEKSLETFGNKKRWLSPLVYINLADIYLEKQEYENALTFLNKALHSKPGLMRLYQIHNRLGILYEKMGKRKDALIHFRKALKLDPYGTGTYQHLGKFFIKNKEPVKAKKYIEKALRIDPYDSYSYFLEGKIYEEEDNLKKAKESYKKSIKIKPDWFYSHYALCLIYIKLNNPLFSKELLETIKLNPHFERGLRLAKIILGLQK